MVREEQIGRIVLRNFQVTVDRDDLGTALSICDGVQWNRVPLEELQRILQIYRARYQGFKCSASPTRS